MGSEFIVFPIIQFVLLSYAVVCRGGNHFASVSLDWYGGHGLPYIINSIIVFLCSLYISLSFIPVIAYGLGLIWALLQLILFLSTLISIATFNDWKLGFKIILKFISTKTRK